MDILCVGEIVADVVARPVENIDFRIDSMLVEEISIKNGGDAMNTSINLARLGNDVALIGKSGNDILGKFLIEKAKEEGVNMEYMPLSEDAPSSKVIALIKNNGERCFLHYSGANDYFSFKDIDLSALDNCKFLHIGGVFHLPRFDGEGTAQLLKYARRKGVITCMDVAWDHSSRWSKVIHPCFKHLNYFIPSINEAKHIAGTDNVKRIAAYLKENGVETVVIKLGEKGSYCSAKDRSFYSSSYSVKAIDTTGAGDSFVAGFLTGLNQGAQLEECITMGTAAAAFVVQKIGATDGMPNLKMLQKFIENNNKLERNYE